MDQKKKKRGFLPFIKSGKATTDPPVQQPTSPKPIEFVKFSNTTGKIEGLPPDIAKLLDSGEIDDPQALAQAINAQKKARIESEIISKSGNAASPPVPQKPDSKSPEIPQKPVIPQKPGENKSPEIPQKPVIPQKPGVEGEYPPVEGEYIEKPKKGENSKTQKPSIDFEYPPVDGEFIENQKPSKKRVKSSREKTSKKDSEKERENKRKSVSSEQIARVKKEKVTTNVDFEYPPIDGEYIPKPKESSDEFIEKPKSDDSLQRRKQVEMAPALPPAKPIATNKKHADYTNTAQSILQKSLPNIPIKPEKPPAIPSKLSTPQPTHIATPPPVGNTPPPLLPPKPGTQKVVAKNYRPAAPGVCPEDIYRSLADLISKDDPRKRYINLVEIGQGSSGTVAVATDLQTNKQVAIKKMILNKGVNQVMVMKAEIMFMKMCKHKNIISYIDSYIVANVLWCVMEYMDAGDLTELIRCSRKQFNEYQVATIIREILQGLAYLHNLPYPIIHRDLKSDNILLGLDGSVKITDFGFAAQLTPEIRTRNEVLGTCCWMAPEIVKGQEYGVKADIWSLGILAQELVDGEPPYYQDPPKQVFMSIATKGRGNFKNPDSLSAAFKNFVKQCTIVDHNTRPSASQLLRHPFLQQSANISTLIPIINQTIAANTIKYEDY